MKQLLSLKRINENSSYPVETTGEDGFYQFFTDGGVHYSVGFMEDVTELISIDYSQYQ